MGGGGGGTIGTPYRPCHQQSQPLPFHGIEPRASGLRTGLQFYVALRTPTKG